MLSYIFGLLKLNQRDHEVYCIQLKAFKAITNH